MKLSILICTIPGRLRNLERLLDCLGPVPPGVEVLYLGDNKRRSIGAKRNALLGLARGEYFAFIDDDDTVEPTYVADLLEAIERHGRPDVVVFDTVTHRADTKTNKVNKVGVEYGRTETADLVTCPPTHTMCWRRALVAGMLFKNMSQGEDVDWVDRVVPFVKKQARVNKILYHYWYDPKVSTRP